VTEGDKLQVFDENFNRSKVAGEVRFCGVANFTMVRMFHPYWSLFGRAPRDMISTDKERCRAKYLQLIRRWRIRNSLPVDDEPDNPIQPDEPDQPRRKRGRPSGRSTGCRAPRARERERRNRQVLAAATRGEVPVAGFAASEPLAISDDEDSDWNDNIPIVQRNRPGTGNARLGDMRNIISSVFGNGNPDQGPEDGVKDDIKDEDETQETTESIGVSNNAATDFPSLQDRSMFTPPLNDNQPLTTQSTENERRSQNTIASVPALPLLLDDDSHFDELRNVLADTLDLTTVNAMQETQECNEDDSFMRELESAAKVTEPEKDVKEDEGRVVHWVPFPIVPCHEVIVIED